MKIDSDIRNAIHLVFRNLKQTDTHAKILAVDDGGLLKMDLRKDLGLSDGDIITLYVNTCIVFNLPNLEITVFERINTINDLYKTIKYFFIQQH